MKKIALIAAALALPLTAAAETYQFTTSAYSVKGKVTCSIGGNTLKPINVNITLNQKAFPGMGFVLETVGSADQISQATISNDSFWTPELSPVAFSTVLNKKKYNLDTQDQNSKRQALTSALKFAGFEASYDTLQIDTTAKAPFQSVLSINSKGKATLTEKATFKGTAGAYESCNVVFNVARKSSGVLAL